MTPGDDGQRGDLSYICEQMSSIDADLPEAAPSSSCTATLRPYQRQALYWMSERESLTHTSSKSETAIHPSWVGHSFPDGTPFYRNKCTGAITVHYPGTKCVSRGGILADAMELGKTIETLSLIATVTASKEFMAQAFSKSSINDDDDDNDPKAKRSKGIDGGMATPSTAPLTKDQPLAPCKATLVVCPMSLLSQWQSEALKHTTITEDKVLLYYGAGRIQSPQQLNDYDIILTTYGMYVSIYLSICLSMK